jgi:hypothetical protein
MSVRVQCPACGGAVVFEVGSSMVAVCPYCRSAVARGDRSVENLGKVADLVDTGAVLRVGLTGKFDGKKFQLTGRTQLQHEGGGVWDEWYVSFPNDVWGWLSEAQGRYYILFEQNQRDDLPEFGRVSPGDPVYLNDGKTRFVVAEAGTATTRGAEGEIPFRFVPGSQYRYADLSGPDGEFATLDYSGTPPAVYIGRETTLDELGVPDNIKREIYELRQVKAKQINCPNCAGPLDLKAPDKTERVGCPYCGSMLDATQGNLTLLTALEKPPFNLAIPLGAKGAFGSDERTVIGAVERSVTVEGQDYFWQEYLLYDERDGFEWLVRAENHWNRVRSVPIGRIDEGRSNAAYNGRAYRLFQSGTATVRGVIGECYWKVQVGERSYTRDFIDPPFMLSSETSSFGSTREMNWSRAEYLEPAAVEKAFNLERRLGKPKGVAPNQVFPFKRIYLYGMLFFALLCVIGCGLLAISPTRTVHEQTFQLRNLTPQPAAPGPFVPGQPIPPPVPATVAQEKLETFFTDKFELKPRKNVRVTISCPSLASKGGYLVAEGDLVQDSNGMVQPFLIGLTHFSGVEDGEAWTESDTVKSEYLSAQPGGTYSLKLEVEKEKADLAGPLIVKVEQGSSSGTMWFLAFLAIIAFPAGVGIYHMVFNSTRWSNSSIEPPDDDDDRGGPPEVELETAKYLKPPPLAIDEPIPMAEEISPSGRPVARPVAKPILKKKKKRPRDEEDDEDAE